MTWAQFLFGLITPLARRALVALGLSVVTYSGVSVALDGVLSYAKSNLAGLPADVIALCGLSGIFTALGIVAGALVAAVAATPLKRIMPS